MKRKHIIMNAIYSLDLLFYTNFMFWTRHLAEKELNNFKLFELIFHSIVKEKSSNIIS